LRSGGMAQGEPCGGPEFIIALGPELILESDSYINQALSHASFTQNEGYAKIISLEMHGEEKPKADTHTQLLT
jgi:hypothetical protein